MAHREVLVQLDDDLVERLAQIAEALCTGRSELLRRGLGRLLRPRKWSLLMRS
ncbi:MAG: ribbon-helix-helix protein, CopG family [Acidimicrobiia bacterium]|nr:ribbon-helix-helix protein, CopG family [Acidimicrobiia bacterium]